jgi:hypothetical protein
LSNPPWLSASALEALKNLKAAGTVAEWNRCIADLVHALTITAQGGVTLQQDRALVWEMVNKVADGFKPQPNRPTNRLRARRDIELKPSILFPDAPESWNFAAAAHRLRELENNNRKSWPKRLGLPSPGENDLLSIAQARGRVRRMCRELGITLPDGKRGFARKPGA